MENSMEVLQNIKNRTNVWSNKTISGYIYDGNENRTLKSYLHFYIYWSIIYNSQDMDTTWVSLYKWMDKEYVVYTQWNTTMPLKKKKKNPAICDNMDGLWGYYAKWKTDRER